MPRPAHTGDTAAASRILAEIASGEAAPNAARVRAAMAVLDRAPVVEFDPTTPEGEEELMRDLLALPRRLLVEALERGAR